MKITKIFLVLLTISNVAMAAVQLPRYTLTVDTAGTGKGTVKVSPKDANYTNGSVVTLKAVPAAGSTFAGWSGAATATAKSVKITISTYTVVTAIFDIIPRYTLTVDTAGTGKGTVKVSPKDANYTSGSVVTLTAVPAAGSTFAGWSGATTATAKSVKITISTYTVVTATFTASMVGSWNMIEFDTPAQISLNGNVLQGGDYFDVMEGKLTINANGTCSGNMGGNFKGTYSIGSDGIITTSITNSDGTGTHTFYINAGKDTMTSIESDTDGQSILIAQRAPSSASASDITGSWNMMEFDTPAQITLDPDNGLQGGGDFDVMEGSLTLNANGTCSGNMGGDFTGTYSIGSDGIITTSVTSSNGTGTFTFYINAGKDTMMSIESDPNDQSIIIAQRVPPSVSPQATLISLGKAADFAVLGGSGVTNADSSTFITGDAGSSPTPTVTGLTPGMVNGILYTTADLTTSSAHTDLITAYNTAADATGGVPGPADLGGVTLTPGVYTYTATSAPWTAGTLTLNALGNPSAQWVFQVGTSLTTPANATVSLVNGASANNVFWQIGSSLILDANNNFAGNILANTSITLGGGTLNGRALTINGAVTISTAETINVP
ncbi:MAG: ice-binding family protein [Sedimentisphaerales bacterium]